MNLVETLQKRGIAVFNNIFDDETVRRLKDILEKDCSYSNEGDGKRYGGQGGTVRCKHSELNRLIDLNLVETIINEKMKSIIQEIIPDGQVWRFYYIQTPSNQTRPHFIPKGGGIGDFHIDRNNPVYKDDRIDFIDFSIYLNDVNKGDGNYAFYPSSPQKKPLGFEEVINVYGKAGTLTVSRVDWYHSATPNLNKNNRHLIRVALCKNFFDIDDYYEERKFLANYYKNKDNFLSFIFGGDRRWYKKVTQPKIDKKNLEFTSPKVNGRINFSVTGKRTNINKEWNPNEIIENSFLQITKNFIKRILKRHV